jgi:hypothetical protein
MEDRGTPLYVWVFEPYDDFFADYASFDYFASGERHILSMPIGWHLESREQGTVLINTFGKVLTALEAFKTFRRR